MGNPLAPTPGEAKTPTTATKKKNGKKTKNIDIQNEIVIDVPPSITGEYNKVPNRRFLKRKQKRHEKDRNFYNLATDIYIEKNKFHIPRQQFDSIKEHYKDQADNAEKEKNIDEANDSNYSDNGYNYYQDNVSRLTHIP